MSNSGAPDALCALAEKDSGLGQSDNGSQAHRSAAVNTICITQNCRTGPPHPSAATPGRIASLFPPELCQRQCPLHLDFKYHTCTQPTAQSSTGSPTARASSPALDRVHLCRPSYALAGAKPCLERHSRSCLRPPWSKHGQKAVRSNYILAWSTVALASTVRLCQTMLWRVAARLKNATPMNCPHLPMCFQIHDLRRPPNAPAQAHWANAIRTPTATQSQPCLHPACHSSHFVPSADSHLGPQDVRGCCSAQLQYADVSHSGSGQRHCRSVSEGKARRSTRAAAGEPVADCSSARDVDPWASCRFPLADTADCHPAAETAQASVQQDRPVPDLREKLKDGIGPRSCPRRAWPALSYHHAAPLGRPTKGSTGCWWMGCGRPARTISPASISRRPTPSSMLHTPCPPLAVTVRGQPVARQRSGCGGVLWLWLEPGAGCPAPLRFGWRDCFGGCLPMNWSLHSQGRAALVMG
jgi:hypothetical protein